MALNENNTQLGNQSYPFKMVLTSTINTYNNVIAYKHKEVMSSKRVTWLSLTWVLVFLCLSVELEAQLQVGFYRTSCGLAEFIVKDEVRKGFIRDSGVAPGLVRMHFHDCFVRVRYLLMAIIFEFYSILS